MKLVQQPQNLRNAFATSLGVGCVLLFGLLSVGCVLNSTPSAAPAAMDNQAEPSKLANTLVFVAYDGQDLELFAKDLATGQLTQLTHNDVDESQPAWSPDGRWLAFTRNQPGAGADIWLLQFEEGELINLTQSVETEQRPTWGAQSETVLFMRSDSQGMEQFYSADLNQRDASPRQLTDSPLGAPMAQLSSDGKLLAYTQRVDEKRQSLHVRAINSALSNKRAGTTKLLLDGSELDVVEFSWIDNSHQLLVAAKAEEVQLYRVDARNAERRAIGGQHSASPEAIWSASRERIYFLASPNRQRRQVFEYDPSSNSRKRVSHSGQEEMYLTADPHYPQLAFAQFQRGLFQLQVLDLRTGNTLAVAPDILGTQMQPVFRPLPVTKIKDD